MVRWFSRTETRIPHFIWLGIGLGIHPNGCPIAFGILFWKHIYWIGPHKLTEENKH